MVLWKLFLKQCVNKPEYSYRSGVGAPVVGDCDGEYNYDSRKNTLQWNLPVIDSSNKSGSMEFSVGGHPDDFFPVTVSFVSKKSYCDIQVSIFSFVKNDLPLCICLSSWINLFLTDYVERYSIVLVKLASVTYRLSFWWL